MKKNGHVYLSEVEGIIRRRILVNYRVQPEIIRKFLPFPFEPKLVRGHAIAGICLIRLEFMRPKGLPAWLGFDSEGAAHRIAVEWTKSGERHEGVYVLRRDTSSLINAWAGSRVFPGTHHLAEFAVTTQTNTLSVCVQSKDGKTKIHLTGERAALPPSSSIFRSTDHASDFFKTGAFGYSPTGYHGTFEVLKLENLEWNLQPFDIKSLHSSLYDDRSVFAEGSICFDSAFLMEDIPHIWRPCPLFTVKRGAP